MKLKKKTSSGIAFARKKDYEYEGQKFEADLKDGDIVTIQNAGQQLEGQFGTQTVFTLKTRNGDKGLALNQKSINNLIDAFGEETGNWIGKEAKVWALRAMVSGKMQTVVYLSPEDWTMTDEGEFVSPNDKAMEDDGITDEDVPFE